jgi:hypothetical protein
MGRRPLAMQPSAAGFARNCLPKLAGEGERQGVDHMALQIHAARPSTADIRYKRYRLILIRSERISSLVVITFELA